MSDVKIVTLDFETFYDDEYSLSKMQTDAYVLDPRFEVIGLGVKDGTNPAHWFTDGNVRAALDLIDWENTAVLCHNTLFDGFIISQVFKKRPKIWLDTLGMSRALYPYLPSHSLKAVAAYLGLGAKGTEVVDNKGMRRADFTPERLAAYGGYCMNDCDMTRKIYDALENRFPLLETFLLDLHIRMFTEPKFELDGPKLVAYREGIVKMKEGLLTGADSLEMAALRAQLGGGTMKDIIMSNPKFAEALKALGVDPPMKVSKATGKWGYAFAKTDQGLTELMDHPDSAVQALVAARLGVKTTIAETRAQKLVETADRGIGFPIYLNYWGAKTTGRASGGNKINALNMPNRGKDRVIRESMKAPAGYRVVVGDSSNIELRTNLVMSGQTDLVQKIRDYDAQGHNAVSDLYCDFSTDLFGKAVTKADRLERTVGKVSELSLGYGAAAVTFQNMLRVQSQGQVDYELPECERIVSLYRRTHDKVVELWDHFGKQTLNQIARGDVMQPVDINGWLLTTPEGFGLPGHIGVVYHDLKRNGDGEWEYQQGRGRVKIYGGKGAENMSQHVARHIVMWQMARFARRYPCVLEAYDEVVSIVPESDAPGCAAYLLECLRASPAWCRGLIPLNGEVGIGENYADAKP